MSIGKTRRDFLRNSALGLAATATARALPVLGMDTPGQAGAISAWVTSDNNRFARKSGLRWQAIATKPSASTIVLNPEKEFQTILGFGAAFTDAACYTFNQLSPAARETLFHELFHPSEMGLNVCRTCIGASDYSTKVYSWKGGNPDRKWERFPLEKYPQYILPTLRGP